MQVVKNVKVLRPYALRVEFDDGACREVDLVEELYGEVFEPLKDPELFSQARVDEELGTVVWPNGADFSPGFLYHQAKSLKKS